jgi:hypothetical protein
MHIETAVECWIEIQGGRHHAADARELLRAEVETSGAFTRVDKDLILAALANEDICQSTNSLELDVVFRILSKCPGFIEALAHEMGRILTGHRRE